MLNPKLTMSPAGLDFLKRWEAFMPHLYEDEAGHATIGYGHLAHYGPINGSEAPFFAGGISERQASDILAADLARIAEPYVNAGVAAAAIAQHRFDALASFCFNLGSGAFLGSTLLKKLNAGDVDGAAAEFGRWSLAGGRRSEGVAHRRAAEARLFLTGEYS